MNNAPELLNPPTTTATGTTNTNRRRRATWKQWVFYWVALGLLTLGLILGGFHHYRSAAAVLCLSIAVFVAHYFRTWSANAANLGAYLRQKATPPTPAEITEPSAVKPWNAPDWQPEPEPEESEPAQVRSIEAHIAAHLQTKDIQN